MKVYSGKRETTGVEIKVLIMCCDGIAESKLLHKVRHSPTGFEWGYGGSGPSELARCILLDMGYPEKEVDMFYQDFKRQFIQPASQNKDFEVYEDAIKLWWEQRHSGTAT